MRTLRAVFLLLLAAPLAAAAPAAAATVASDCSPSAAGTTYRAPSSGYLSTRLAGDGDWDLMLRDASSGRRIGGSEGFGSDELVQTWIGAGQKVVAQACRRAGSAPSAQLSFSVLPVAAPANVTPSLVRVRGAAPLLARLDRMKGLDVTESRGRDWADVVVAGSPALTLLRATGLPFTTRIADLRKAYDNARAADRAYTAAVGEGGSPLPSGRTTYRTPEDVQSELKALVDEHPDLARPVVIGRTYQGREISGVEIARDVQAQDGRPTFFLMGAHHAREWPSAEAAMEYATMLVKDAAEPRIASLLASERTVVVPVVNVDGYVSTRGALDLADASGDPGDVLSLVEAVAPPGGSFAYRRKNCDGEIGVGGPALPCELTWGVDNNRNYGNLWGGPGSSADVTSQSYHGPGPRSEPETQAVWNFARTHQVTFLMTLHTVAALVLRPPGLSGAGLAPDEARMKELGDAMGNAAGYTSQYSWQLYDTAGTTEDDTYAATGAYGYTIEMGPEGGNFHEAYETAVVDEWTGANDHAQNRGGLREALLIAGEAAADARDHAVLTGTAPAGSVLRLRRAFDTVTSPWCAKGIDPVVNVGAALCLTGEQDPLTLHDELDTTTTVPASGTFEWHVNQSTRPFVGRDGRTEAYTLTCATPDGQVRETRPVTIARGETQALDLACGGPGA